MAGGAAGRALIAALLLVNDDSLGPETLRATSADVDHQSLVELADSHRVGALLYPELRDRNVLPSPVLAGFSEQYRFAIARQLTASHTITTVAEALDEAIGRRWVVMKGPALAAWHGTKRRRPYIDLDLLVPRTSFAVALDALEAAGFPSMTNNWSGFLEHGVGEIPLGSHQMVIDLHWDPIGLSRTRRDFAFDVEAMIDRQVTFECGDGRFPTLDPVDTLIHLCVHGGLGGARRLIWLVDIDAVARSITIDWDVFVSRARANQAAMMAATMLDRCRRLLGTPIPDDVVGRLGTMPGWTRLNRLTARDRSDAKLLDGWSSGFVQVATRDAPRAALRAVARVAIDEVRYRRGGARPAAAGGEIDWDRADPVAERAQTKQAWLDYVASDRP